MKDSGERGLVQAYNAQIAVDSQAQIIVAAELTQQPIDRQQLLPMVKTLRSMVDAVPTTITADAGYWDTISLLDPAMSGIEMLIAPDSSRIYRASLCRPILGRCPWLLLPKRNA
jgi:Transposase DDE domain